LGICDYAQSSKKLAIKEAEGTAKAKKAPLALVCREEQENSRVLIRKQEKKTRGKWGIVGKKQDDGGWKEQGVWVWVSTSLLAAAASTVTEKVTSKALENASGKAFATE
jgi:hypothetical protein